jgi:hypothetical protein
MKMERIRVLVAIAILSILGSILGSIGEPARAQMPSHEPNTDPMANFPPVPTLSMYGTVDTFKTEVESDIAAMRQRVADGKVVVALVDTLVAAFDRYGNYMDRTYGDFPNMSRNRPYWLITTDNAADTLTDRVASVIEGYVKANPNELLGEARAEWESASDKLGVPQSRLFGFQFVELARRASILRKGLIQGHPADAASYDDANIRFLWDLVQFYRQLHATWYDRHSMRVADEDWVIHRTTGRCKDMKWRIAFSLTAVGVDTSKYDPMTDKFMHRLQIIDPGCPDTVDFVMSLPHYRLMEKELDKLSPAQKDSLLNRSTREAEQRGARQQQGAPGQQGAPKQQASPAPEGSLPRNAVPEEKH